MGFLKEKSSYRPTGPEQAFAWIFTVGSGVAVAVFVLRSWLGA